MDLACIIVSGLIFNGLIVCFSMFLIVGRFAAKYLSHKLRWWLRWDIILSIIIVVVESTSAALEETSPHKLKTAEYGMLMATITLALGFADLGYKKYMQRRNRKANNDMPHLHLEWDFVDTFGLISSILTLITASLDYHYLRIGKQQPIQFSLMPLAFAVCVFCSCVLKRPVDQPTFIMRCRHQGPTNRDIECGENVYDGDGTTQFVCSVCQVGQMHPHVA